MEYKTVKYSKDGRGVAKLTLNRPEVLNAMNLRMRTEQVKAFEEADRDPEVKILVITGAGRAFCAGLDVKEASKTYGVKRSPYLMI